MYVEHGEYDIYPTFQSPLKKDREKAYLQKVMALYSGAKKASDTGPRDGPALLGKELELMMEFRLGKALDDHQLTDSILKQQVDFLKHKSEIDQALIGSELGAQKYAKEVNEPFGEVLRQVAEIMGVDKFKKVFGLSPPEGSYNVIDPEIAAKVHAHS